MMSPSSHRKSDALSLATVPSGTQLASYRSHGQMVAASSKTSVVEGEFAPGMLNRGKVLSVLHPGTYFGDEGLFSPSGRWRHTIVAATHVEVLALDRENFYKRIPKGLIHQMEDRYEQRQEFRRAQEEGQAPARVPPDVVRRFDEDERRHLRHVKFGKFPPVPHQANTHGVYNIGEMKRARELKIPRWSENPRSAWMISCDLFLKQTRSRRCKKDDLQAYCLDDMSFQVEPIQSMKRTWAADRKKKRQQRVQGIHVGKGAS